MVEQFILLLKTVGLWVVFLVTFSETAFFIGLLIPAEATILVAGFMAAEGHFNVLQVFAVTFLGGLLGDQTGYFIGRYGSARLARREGRVALMWRRHEPRALRLFQRRALVSVSLARCISFVRTLMPMMAGMTRMSYPRFLLHDLIGVLAWAAASVALGYLAGESWREVAHVLGTGSAIAITVALFAAWWVAGRKKRRSGDTGSGIVMGMDVRELVDVLANRPALRVALTGNIASGKSTVARSWQELGAHIIDADALARRAVEPGSAGQLAVREAFGAEIMTPDGEIDRAKVRAIVFADASKRRELEAIVHPEVKRLREEEEARLIAAGANIIVNVIPLLFEAGLDQGWDVIVHVHSADHERWGRLTELRGLGSVEAQRMIDAQQPSDGKKLKSHIVIENDADLDTLEQRATDTWLRLQTWPALSV